MASSVQRELCWLASPMSRFRNDIVGAGGALAHFYQLLASLLSRWHRSLISMASVLSRWHRFYLDGIGRVNSLT